MNFMGEKRPLFAILIGILLVYYALFIYRSSFVIEGKRYFVLFDDEMISMRYAKNFANGYGLVWNKGERVEGITNLFWTLYMSLFHIIKIPLSKTSLFIQVTGLIFLILSVIMVKRITYLITNSEKISLTATVLTGFYYPIVYWSLEGTEVSVLMFLTSLSTYYTLRGLTKHKLIYSPLWILGFSTLIRMDMFVLYLGFWAFTFWVFKNYRIKIFLIGFIIITSFVGGQTLFRLLYYGDILPNTYYLKMTGFPIIYRVTRGAYVFLNFLWQLNIIFVLVTMLMTIVMKKKSDIFLFFLFALQSLYSIYVGGDAWEESFGSNRFIALVMPYFFILFSKGVYNLRNFLQDKLHFFFKRFVFYIFVILGFLNFNSTYGPGAIAESMLIVRPKQKNFNYRNVKIALLLNDITKRDAKVAVTCAGATPYFCERYFIDLLGKTDRIVARATAKPFKALPLIITFIPGHMKHNYDYSIRLRKPDVIVVNMWYNPEEVEKLLKSMYVKVDLIQGLFVYLYKGSEKILWDCL